MIDFIRKILREGGVPVGFVRTPNEFGAVAEFRWFRYLNSKVPCVKTDYHVSEDEADEIRQLLLAHHRLTGVKKF